MRKAVYAVLIGLTLLLTACPGGGGPPPDFSLSLNPTSLTVQQGGSGTTQLTLTPQNGFTGPVTLALERQDGTAAPSGITLSPTSVTVSGSSPVSQALTLSVGGSVATGTYNLRVKATSGSLVRTANFTLTVSAPPDFTISLNPTSLTVQQGGSGTTQLTLTPQNGFTGPVTLALERQDGTAAPSGITLSPTSVTVSGSSPVSQALTLSVGGSVATGTYNLRVKATSGSLTRTANLSLTVTALPGTISGSVRDAVSGSPLEGVTVTVYQQASIVTTGTTDSTGAYSLSVPAGSGYHINFSKPGYIPADYYNITVQANTTTYLESVLQIDTAHSGTGDVSGRIVNALTGVGVGGLTIDLRVGINTTTGPIVATTTTQSNGFYSFTGLNAGHYTAEVSGSGYITTYFTIICIGGTTTPNQNATITPILSSGEIRIVLTWGATPSDLDSHLTGPLPDGSRFHVYFANKRVLPYAELDVDDTTSYGPETITIYQRISGVYRYSVHDYSNKNLSRSYALSNSGAQVRVYSGNNLVATFNVPQNQEGTLWTVFEMDGDTGTITPVNRMSYQSNPSDVQSVGTDAELMRSLPPKR